MSKPSPDQLPEHLRTCGASKDYSGITAVCGKKRGHDGAHTNGSASWIDRPNDERLLELWRFVSGPQAGLTGPLIRFAAMVKEDALASSAPAPYEAHVTGAPEAVTADSRAELLDKLGPVAPVAEELLRRMAPASVTPRIASFEDGCPRCHVPLKNHLTTVLCRVDNNAQEVQEAPAPVTVPADMMAQFERRATEEATTAANLYNLNGAQRWTLEGQFLRGLASAYVAALASSGAAAASPITAEQTRDWTRSNVTNLADACGIPPGVTRLRAQLATAEQSSQQEINRLRQLAKEATNGWACYAKRKIEHDEIARLHREIDRAAFLVRSEDPTPTPETTD